MSEVSFSRQFLSALDSRPIKLSGDHISDPKGFAAQSAYTLPKLPHPPHPTGPKRKTAAPTTTNPGAQPSTPSISITLKPMRSTSQTISLPSITPSTTSIYDLKSSYSQETSTDVNKIKLLYKKKPVTDSKTVAEILGGAGDSEVKEAEFSVMILGAATSGVATNTAATPPIEVPKEKETLGGPAAQGPSGKEVLSTDEFWQDLKGFLVQRLRDENEGERLLGIFRESLK